MDKPLNVLYYNTFLPMKMGEGLVSRHFLSAAAQLDGWRLTTVPSVTPAMLAESNVLDRHKNGGQKGQRRTTWAALRKSVRRLKSPMSRVPIAPYLYTRKMVREVTAVLHNHHFDGLLLHLSQQDLKTLAEVARNVSLPLVLRAPAPFAYQADHVLQRHMSRADRQHEHFLYETAVAILVISEGMKALFVAMGVPESKIHVVPNGIDLGAFAANGAEGQAVRQRLGLAQRKVVGYVGGFWPGNDLDTLLRAWQHVEQAEPQATLLLVGYGPELHPAQKLSASLGLQNCVWTGRVDFSQVPGHLAAMNVGVGPYTAEALAYVSPLKVIEYMAMGLPVVATCGGQIAELIDNGVTGFLYQAGCETQLADQILTLLANPTLANEMGTQARQKIKTWHSWDNAAQKVQAICCEVMRET
jgi:glycosyltransferase involved in cell wall biosynthesis